MPTYANTPAERLSNTLSIELNHPKPVSWLSSGVPPGSGLLCDVTNETSVSDMLCRDNKEICKHCKENYSTEDTWRSQEEAEPGESLYSGQSFARYYLELIENTELSWPPLWTSIFPVSSLIL
jgi:hypothetical protein